jgi:hypothetical protein
MRHFLTKKHTSKGARRRAVGRTVGESTSAARDGRCDLANTGSTRGTDDVRAALLMNAPSDRDLKAGGLAVTKGISQSAAQGVMRGGCGVLVRCQPPVVRAVASRRLRPASTCTPPSPPLTRAAHASDLRLAPLRPRRGLRWDATTYLTPRFQ